MAEGADMARVERQPGFLHRTSTKIALAGSGLVLAAAGAIGVKTGLEKGGSSPENSNPAVVLPVIPQPTEGPKLATPIPSLTPEATHTPTATSTPGANPDAKFPPPATPEAQVEVPRLPGLEQYYKDAVVIEAERKGEIFFLIGLNLPVETPIRAPVNGQVLKTKNQPDSLFKGFSARIHDQNFLSPNVPLFVFRGDIKFPDMINVEGANAGDQIGTMQDTGISNFGYNLIIEVETPAQNPNKLPSPRATLEKYFPEAFEKPAKKVDLDTLRPAQSTYMGNVYN